MNMVDVIVNTELGCDIDAGEYGTYITGFVGALDIDSYGGVDDISLIKGAVAEAIMNKEIELSEEGSTNIRLQESGEWEDVFWHKYYIIMPKTDNSRVMEI